MRLSTVLAGAFTSTVVMAHPGHDHTQEMLERRDYFRNRPRDLSHCAEKLRRDGLQRRAAERRAKRALDLVDKRTPNWSSMKKRQIEDFLDVDHESSEEYSMDTNPADLFEDVNACVLSPEVTEGPYYVSGEYVREDNTEDQEGVFLGVDAQVIDVDTCEPVPDVYVEIWHCNATGVYSGVVASSNGAGEDDPGNLDNTFLRGVQKTDEDGVVAFNSIFPGHYAGRATHIHVMVHAGATALPNGTLYSSTATHVGQMFFDQDLISQVEETAPYNSNEQELTTNADDGILAEEAATGADPFMTYVTLGDSVEDGILAWLAFGIDLSNTRNVTAAATHYEGGGVENPDAGGPPGGGPGLPGGFPSGVVPTGAVPTGF